MGSGLVNNTGIGLICSSQALTSVFVKFMETFPNMNNTGIRLLCSSQVSTHGASMVLLYNFYLINCAKGQTCKKCIKAIDLLSKNDYYEYK